MVFPNELGRVMQGSIGAEICVIGRCNFSSGIGLLTYSFAEALSRSFPTCILPTEPNLREEREIKLPNGRSVPVWRGQTLKASIFVDVFWNGTWDLNYTLVPSTGLRLACIVWDSDVFPSEWMNILNARYDAAVITSPHLREPLERSGCEVPIICVPPPLDLEPLLRRPFVEPSKKIRVGCVAAFHPRKGTPLLLRAFAEACRGLADVELLLHSNLAFPGAVDRVKREIERAEVDNVILSTENMSIEAKTDLIDTIDIFANLSRGEGYSIGPREALAMGKVCVLSNVGGHIELGGTPGVFMVAAPEKMPARFPEIDNRVFGEQRVVRLDDAVQTIGKAIDYVRNGSYAETVIDRRNRAADFSFSRLSNAVAELIDPAIGKFRRSPQSPPEVVISDEYRAFSAKIIRSSGGLSGCRRVVIPAHDAGFFSIFNVFFTHLAWAQQDHRVHMVLPDWDVNRFKGRHAGSKPVSFCYGRPEDGNIWTKFFEPLYGLDAAQFEDPKFLYEGSEIPDDLFNTSREPLMTYVNAYRLYKSPDFQGFRNQYHRVLQDHIILEPGLKKEVATFASDHLEDAFIIGAHVRHPSHTVEQPGALIAHTNDYIRRIRRLVEDEVPKSRSWKVFLATDQERVVRRFKQEFGDRLAVVEDARRTTDVEDSKFDSAKEKNADGFQLQHIVASSEENWSTSMAREVIRDAFLMGKCDVLFHVVSNVSTAVSYINPQCRMIFI
ncbi:glycosyltransferase [Sphingobium sp. AN558]|uniref:glycosyltransferase n=1 Tax=Sphingobium sp. AN558 TaxID=3133442 RepID=UPI0030C08C49